MNGLTIHLRGTGYTPNVVTVDNTDPAAAGTPDTIQAGIDAAAPGDVVVIRPGGANAFNPKGLYQENVVLDKEVQIQGVGPGGYRANGSYVMGSGIDASTFDPDATLATWFDRVFTQDGYAESTVPDGAAITVLGEGDLGTNADNFTGGATKARIDGLTVTGGTQQNFIGNVNAVTGAVNTPQGATGALVTQGGGLYVHSGAQDLQIANNIVVGNGGWSRRRPARRHAVRRGQHPDSRQQQPRPAGSPTTGSATTAAPTWPAASRSSPAPDGYEFAGNDVCGNFSEEYGGGLSHYGLSPGNASIRATASGSTPRTTRAAGSWSPASCRLIRRTPATGRATSTIEANDIKLNLSNDDGGGGSGCSRSASTTSTSSTTPSPTTCPPTRAAVSPSTTPRR